MVLRFRDLVTAPGGTMQEHHEVIKQQGFVWWGWWSKAGETIADDVFRHLKERANGDPLTVYLFDSGHNRVYRATCNDIEWKTTHARFGSPDSKRSPLYYKGQKYLAWFNFREIVIVQEDPAVLQTLTCLKVDEFFENPPSRYTPFYGKRIDSPEELRQQDRTIWFVRPFKGGDATHSVSLLDPDQVKPAHFPTHVIESPSPYVALVSDLHFSVDGHHNFPETSTHDRFDLGQCIETCLLDKHVESIAAIVLAGDLTWKATKDEYELARAFLHRITTWSKLRNYQYVICPGNHDVAFSDDPSKKGAAITVAPADARRAYEDFYESLFYLRPNEFLCSGRRFLLAGNIRVDMVAINSSLLEQHKGAFQGHGFVGEAQLRHAAEQMGWDHDSPDHQPRAHRVVVVHHHLLPVTYREEAKSGALYSVALDAEATMRWLVKHRVDLVVHGHMHQPFVADIWRPIDTAKPQEKWHRVTVLGMGSAGVTTEHLGEVKDNTFGLLDFSHRDRVQVKVFTVHPTNPSKDLWSFSAHGCEDD